MTVKARSDIRRRLRIFEHAQKAGNVSKTCRYFEISREIFYQWKRAYEALGETALINSKPCPQNPKIRVSKSIEEKILYIRKTYHFGALRISWYLERYHGIKVSSGGVQGVLKRNGLNRLSDFARKRSKIANFQRYENRVPGHHIQMDVKFLKFITEDNRKVKRFQYTAIDDATRTRVLKIYKKHTQKNAIDSVGHVIEKLPFQIHTIRTDNGHGFQSQFHWHVLDLGINHVYIKPRTTRLNGKFELSHLLMIGSSISYWNIKAMSTFVRSLKFGRIITIFIALMEPTREQHLSNL